MILFIDDYNQHEIEITDTIRTWRIPKFRITMTVEEPYLYLYWNDREKGDGGDIRLLTIDYNDVVDGYAGYVDNPPSATALMASIEAMIVSGFNAGGDVLTAKADLLSHDGVSDTILPGGTNEYILSRDNSTQTGLKWINPTSLNVTVEVDGITITGDGSVGNPLVGHSAGGANLWGYKAKTTITTGDPLASHVIWNNATQISATQLNISHITDDGFDIDLYFPYIVTGDILIVQDRDDSSNYQTWVVSATPTIIPNSHIEIPVTFNSSGGTGTTNFANNHQLLIAKFGSPSSSGIDVSAGTASANLSSIVFSNLNGISFGLNGSTITASHNGITSQSIQPAIGLNTAGTNITWTANSSGISIDAGAYLTTARASNDAIGLNTAATNITWTVNSSGISLNASGYAGIGTSATNASITLNSNGLAISVAAPGAGATPAISVSNGSFTFSTVSFGNLNGASFYSSNGSVVMSYTVPSAGAAIAISRYPEYSQIPSMASVATGSIGTTGGSTQVTATGYIAYQPIPHDIHYYDLMHQHSNVTVAGTGSATIGHMIGVYTLDANTRMSLLSSFQNVMFISQNSVSARSHHWFWGTASSQNSSAASGNISGSFSGLRWMYMNESEMTLPKGNYYIAYMQTANTAGSNVYAQSLVGMLNTQSNFLRIGGNQNINDFLRGYNGAFSTTTNMSSIGLPVMPSTINTSAIINTINISQLRAPHFIMQRYSTT